MALSDAPPSLLLLLVVLLLLLPLAAHSRQVYINNEQLDCYATNGSSTLGYSCAAADAADAAAAGPASCKSYLTYRSQTNYQTPQAIARLLGSDSAATIARINGVAEADPIPLNDLVLVPVDCSCTGGKFYQSNASYVIKKEGETYFTIANETYQGLSACQALMAQNPAHESRQLYVNLELVVPLRCACPSGNQSAAGAKYLLSYLVMWEDYIEMIAARFNASEQAVFDANNLNPSDLIYPFTTILVPLTTEPTKLGMIPSPPPPPAAESPISGEGEGGSGKRPIIVGVGVGAGVLVLLCGFLAVWFVSYRRRRRRLDQEEGRKSLSKSSPPPPVPHQKMLDWLTVYAFEDLEKATGSFSEERRIKGSVYLADINGDRAAVKRLKGDVSSEIGILKQVNHSNVIRLSGFCHHEGSTYLVYEFAEKGSLADWIHGPVAEDWSAGDHLDWTRRVRIACDIADGLNYLHNSASPPYIHKDLKSSNILLDGEFRAKVGNFGLARPAAEDGGGGGDAHLTRHVVGTQGYMAPEYLEHGLVSPKLDVFAFGVVLLELLSGREATYPDPTGEGKRDCLLSGTVAGVLGGEDVREKLKNFMDPRLQEEYPFSMAFAMAQLAMRCVLEDPNSRPNSGDLLVALSAIYRSSLDWEPSDLSHSGSIADDF